MGSFGPEFYVERCWAASNNAVFCFEDSRRHRLSGSQFGRDFTAEHESPSHRTSSCSCTQRGLCPDRFEAREKTYRLSRRYFSA